MELSKDGWKLSIAVEWVPVIPDTKESCHTCRGTGMDYLGEDACSSCIGNGFRYTQHPRGQQPEVSARLVQRLRKTYKEWYDSESSE